MSEEPYPTIIYAVSCGDYSDSSVDFLTFDKDGGQKYVDDMNKYEGYPSYQLEEFEIKTPIPEIKHFCSIAMKKSDDVYYSYILASESFEPWKIRYVNYEWSYNDYIVVNIPGTNLDKAIRIVNEIRIKMIYHDKWGDESFIQEMHSICNASPTELIE